MRDKLRHLLLDSINAKEATEELETHFYEILRDAAQTEPILMDRLLEYPTVEEYLEADLEDQSYDTQAVLLSLEDDLDYLLMYRFDQVEDGIKKEMIHGAYTAEVIQDMRKDGIIRLGNSPLTEDEVEEYYVDIFMEFDAKREKILDEANGRKPAEFYEAGEQNTQNYKKSHHLLMDETDFMTKLKELFDEKLFTAMVASLVYESIRYHSHYELEAIEDEEGPFGEEEEDSLLNSDLEDLPVGPSEADAILVPDGDLKVENYTYLYELLYEYNGKRVLPSDEGGSEEAYWGTFQDDFEELMADFLLELLDNTIQYYLEKESAAYDSLARFYHWTEEDRKDPITILETSDKLNFQLTMLRDQLWENITEAPVQELYTIGEELTKNSLTVPEGEENDPQIEKLLGLQ